MIEMLRIYSKGFLENVTIEELTPGSTVRNVFDFWNNLVLNYSWEPVPIAQRFLGSLRLRKVIRHEKCQFSPTSLGVVVKIRPQRPQWTQEEGNRYEAL